MPDSQASEHDSVGHAKHCLKLNEANGEDEDIAGDEGDPESAAGERAQATSVKKLEHDALLAAASVISNLADEELHTGDDPVCDDGKGGRGRNRRKGKGRRTNADLNSFESKVTGKAIKVGKSRRSRVENECLNDLRVASGGERG
ncbi:hypothetical protein ACLOJK_003583 [Asimina triloba]